MCCSVICENTKSMLASAIRSMRGEAFSRNSTLGTSALSLRAASIMLADTSTPTTCAKCRAIARDRRPAPQPKSSASQRPAGRPAAASAASWTSTSTSPVARNSSGSQRPPRLSACESTAHIGSSRPSVCQTRRRCSNCRDWKCRDSGFGIRDSGTRLGSPCRAPGAAPDVSLFTNLQSRIPNPGFSGLDQLDAIEALAQRVRVAALGELDLESHLVGGIGVAQRVLVADLAGLVQLEQALVEGLHAEVGRLLHHVLELVDLALADVVLNQRRAEHHFHRDAARLAVRGRDHLLRDHALEVQREVHEQLFAAILGEEVDDAVQR